MVLVFLLFKFIKIFGTMMMKLINTDMVVIVISMIIILWINWITFNIIFIIILIIIDFTLWIFRIISIFRTLICTYKEIKKLYITFSNQLFSVENLLYLHHRCLLLLLYPNHHFVSVCRFGCHNSAQHPPENYYFSLIFLFLH